MISETNSDRTALGVTFEVAKDVGKRLKATRETVNKTTSWMASRIKVREHYLVAIEDGRWNDLPSGLHGRGLVRIYAKELGVAVPELEPKVGSVAPAFAPVAVSNSHVEDVPIIRAGPRQRAAEHYSPPTHLQTSLPKTSARFNVKDRDPIPPVMPSNDDVDDDSPLGIVTPDINVILGLIDKEKEKNNFNLASSDQNKYEDSVSNSKMDIPSVNAAEMAEELFGKQDVQKENTFQSDTNIQALSSDTLSKENITPVSEVPGPTSLRKDVVAAPASPKSVNQMSAVRGTYGDDNIKKDLPSKEPHKEGLNKPTFSADSPSNVSTKSLLGMPPLTLLASVLIAASALGVMFFIQTRNPTPESVNSNEEILTSSSGVVDGAPNHSAIDVPIPSDKILEASSNQVAKDPEKSVGTLESPKPTSPFTIQASAPPPPSVVGNSDDTSPGQRALQAKALPVNPTSKDLPSDPLVKAGQPLETSQVDKKESNTPEAGLRNGTLPTGQGVATLLISQPVHVRIISDNKNIQNGVLPAGPFEFPFKEADIWIKDGSKAHLKVVWPKKDGIGQNSAPSESVMWDYGPLGHPGRKRKIRLFNHPLNK